MRIHEGVQCWELKASEEASRFVNFNWKEPEESIGESASRRKISEGALRVRSKTPGKFSVGRVSLRISPVRFTRENLQTRIVY